MQVPPADNYHAALKSAVFTDGSCAVHPPGRGLTHTYVQVPPADNYYAALNSAVFTDGSFVYIPQGVDCPMELSTYFRINAEETGQVRSGMSDMLPCKGCRVQPIVWAPPYVYAVCKKLDVLPKLLPSMLKARLCVSVFSAGAF